MALIALVCAAALSGCGGGAGGRHVADSGAPDAGWDAGSPIEITCPVAPAPPAPPVFTPCPAGWREVADADDPTLVVCDPWPATGYEACTGASAHFPGGAGCERIGPDCPAGDYADDLPAGTTIVHVLAGAAPGGDGSIASPFATVAEGVAAAPDSAVVAISKGTFVEGVVVDRPITLHGACADETTIAADTPGIATLLLSGGAHVESLRVSGERIGIRVETTFVEPDPVVVESILVEGAIAAALSVGGMAVVTARDFIARDTRAELDGFDLGYGIYVGGDCELDVERAVLERSHDAGVIVWGPGRLVARDLVVRESEAAETGAGGMGILVLVIGNADLERVVVEGNRAAGVRVADQSNLVATDLVVTDTREDEAGHGIGLDVEGVSHVTAHRTRLDGSHLAGLSAKLSSHVVATDFVARDGTSDDRFGSGEGILVQDGDLSLVRAALRRSRYAAIQADAAVLDVEDLVIADATAAFGGGYGIIAANASTIDLARARITDVAHAGIDVEGVGTALAATDLEIADVESDPILVATGYGLSAIDGATSTLERTAIRSARSSGIILAGLESSVHATDLLIEDTRSEERRLDFGYGITLLEGTSAWATRARITGSRRAGVVAFGQSVLDLNDVEILGTLARECAEAPCVEDGCEPCVGEGGGAGIVAIDAAEITATRFRSAGAALCGVQVARGGGIDLHDGEVSGNPVGANVQDPDFDIERLRDGVVYSDNDVALDGSSLPLPDPIESL